MKDFAPLVSGAVRSSLSSPGLGTCFASPGNEGMCLKALLTEQVHCERSIRSKKEVQKTVVRSQSGTVPLVSLPGGWRLAEAPEMPPPSPSIISTTGGTGFSNSERRVAGRLFVITQGKTLETLC